MDPNRFCANPCPCCYYNVSTEVDGVYTVGWRKFGGYWSWWHKGAPHAWVDGEDPSLGVNDPSVPRCACCYYNFMEGVPPGPGWYVGEWSTQYGSWTWQWCNHGAPHAPGPNNVSSWDDVPDDARFMQWLMLAEDGETYIPRPGVDQEDEPDEPAPGDAVPGPAAEAAPGQVAPGQVEDDVPDADDGTTFDLGDSLEQAQVQSAVWESLLERIERYDRETMEELEEQGVDAWAEYEPATDTGVPGRDSSDD